VLCCTSSTYGIPHLMRGLLSHVSCHVMGGLCHTTGVIQVSYSHQLSYHTKAMRCHSITCHSIRCHLITCHTISCPTLHLQTSYTTYGMAQQQAKGYAAPASHMVWCTCNAYEMAHLQGGKVKEESLASSCRVSLLPVVIMSHTHTCTHTHTSCRVSLLPTLIMTLCHVVAVSPSSMSTTHHTIANDTAHYCLLHVTAACCM